MSRPSFSLHSFINYCLLRPEHLSHASCRNFIQYRGSEYIVQIPLRHLRNNSCFNIRGYPRVQQIIPDIQPPYINGKPLYSSMRTDLVRVKPLPGRKPRYMPSRSLGGNTSGPFIPDPLYRSYHVFRGYYGVPVPVNGTPRTCLPPNRQAKTS